MKSTNQSQQAENEKEIRFILNIQINWEQERIEKIISYDQP